MTIDDVAERWAYEMESPFRSSQEHPTMSMSDLMEGERWSEATEQVAFREAVLAGHVERARRKKGAARPDLQPSQVSAVAGTNVRMATAAAARAGQLLEAANRAIADARRAENTAVGATVKVTAQSGYRGSEHQARLWRAYFPRYYNKTDGARQRLTGGPHSPAAIKYMLEVHKIPRRIAAPGYSNHQAGIAIDFRQVLKGADRIRNSTDPTAVARWRNTWFFRWLQQNAARFGFQPYTAEPWHWEYRPSGAQREQVGLEDLESESFAEEERWGPAESEDPELEAWTESEQWEAEESEDPELEAWTETEQWETEESEDPELEAGTDTEQWEAMGSETETETFHEQFTNEAEGGDLLGELFAAGFAENLEESEGVVDTETPSGQVFDSEVEFEEFTGSEHKAIGDGGSGTAPSSISYGSPARLLTFGDVVALAGDYFATYEEMRKVAGEPGGRTEIAWARWHCLDLKKQKVPEPPANKAQKKRVIERYFLLASRNLSHFSAGGSAWEAYVLWHSKAIADALEAGQRSDKTAWQRALTKEAFGDHFLTDMFSAGHVRMPRAAIRDWYGRQLPHTTARLLGYMAKFMYDRLGERQQMPPLARFYEWIAGGVTAAMAEKIQTLGGEAVRTFSLGDIVGLALHDRDNKGLQVVSDVDSNGRKVSGGHKWTALGDAHLGSVQGSKTKMMATAAVITSLRDLERVRGVGVKIGSRPISLAQKAAAVKQALGGPIFAARGFVPREDRTSSANVPMVRADGGKAQLDWRWGQLGDVAYRAVDETVKGQIANQLSELVDSIDDPAKGSLGTKIYGTRNAYRSFVKHLRTEGIMAIEKAVGKRAR